MLLDRFLSTVSIAVQLDVFWLTLKDVTFIGIIRRVAGSTKALNIDLLRAVTLISQAPATGNSTLKIAKKKTITKAWAMLHLSLTASQLSSFNARELSLWDVREVYVSAGEHRMATRQNVQREGLTGGGKEAGEKRRKGERKGAKEERSKKNFKIFRLWGLLWVVQRLQ